MSDNPTRETPDSRSFEERVFARFDALDARLTSMDNRLSVLETKVDRLDTRLTTLEGKVDALDGRLTALEEKVDMRLRETRPIWEAVQSRLDGIESRLTKVEGEIKLVHRTIRAVHRDILQKRVEEEELYERVDELERGANRQ